MIQVDSLSGNARRARPISLTALIDVVFILLMFFMLTSSFSQWQMLDLLVPTSNEQTEQDAPAVLIVYENEFALLTDTIKRPILLKNVMAELSNTQLKQSLVISGEQSVKLGRLLDVYEQLQALGFKDLQIGQSISEKK